MYISTRALPSPLLSIISSSGRFVKQTTHANRFSGHHRPSASSRSAGAWRTCAAASHSNLTDFRMSLVSAVVVYPMHLPLLGYRRPWSCSASNASISRLISWSIVLVIVVFRSHAATIYPQYPRAGTLPPDSRTCIFRIIKDEICRSGILSGASIATGVSAARSVG